jgi:hypothetical protein
VSVGGITGGPYIGSPSFNSCAACVPTQTPTRTPLPTPTNTPTPSTTPAPCDYTEFCIRSSSQSLSAYSGSYSAVTFHNSRLYYTGNGITTGYIYHNGIQWCLSDGLDNPCILGGAIPCYSSCPDLASNVFSNGACPQVPVQPNCDIIDFMAYFDCDYVPPPIPNIIDCDDVGFEYTTFTLTPTPTPSFLCLNGIDFSLSSYTPSNMVTPTPTPTPTIRNNQIGGAVTYEMMDKTFACVSVKVLLTKDGNELYSTDELIFNGNVITLGTSFVANINGNLTCVTYVRNDDSLSSNCNVNSVVQLCSSCLNCI